MLMEMKMVVVVPRRIPISEQKPTEFQIERIEVITDDLIRTEDKQILQCKDLTNENKPFITKNHFRDKWERDCVPAFKLIPETSEENINEFVIFYGVDENIIREFRKIGDLFIDMPDVAYLEGDYFWKIKYKNEPTTGTLGFVHPGYTKILLKRNENGTLCDYDHERMLLVLPSSVSIEQLEVMIKEIMYIRRELISLDARYIEKAKAFFGLENEENLNFNWELQLKWIKNCLAQIEPYLRMINGLPRKNLKKIKQEKSYQQIRKITPTIIEQYIKNSSRKKYLIEANKSSLDIYEHRLLKCKLLELKKFVESQNAQNKLNAEEEEIAIVNKMAQLADKDYSYTSGLKFEDIKIKWKKYSGNILNRFKFAENRFGEEFDEKFLKHKNLSNSILTTTNSAEIIMELRHIEFIRMSILDNKLQFVYSCDNDYKNKELSVWYFCNTKEERHLIERLIIFSEDSCALLAIYEELIKVIEKQNGTSKNLTTVKLEGISYYHEKYRTLTLDKINHMVINCKDCILSNNEESATQKLRKVYIEERIGANYSLIDVVANRNNIIGIESKFKDNKKLLNQNVEYYLDYVVKKIDELLKLPLFENVKPGLLQPWRMTQIFTNDHRYHQIYRRLYLLDKICDFSFSEHGEKILHDKVDRLYEYWVLAKLLEKLIIHQKWVTADGNSDVSKIFNNIFSKDRKNAGLQKVCLKHVGESHYNSLTLELYYDTQLKLSIGDLIKRYKHNSETLRPDFLFRVKNGRTYEEKIFVLDVKYRKYDEMKGDCWISQDLNNVCVTKYLIRPERDLGVDQIATSFIVHSDMTYGNETNNTNKYLGKYVSFNGFANQIIGIPLIEGKDGSKCQIGSFYLTPYVKNEYNQSNDNLTTYFEMMFEYFMGEWKTCWNCGSHSVKVKTLLTIGGYKKYYMTCTKCNAFWVNNHDTCGVPIIKHLINYHIEEKYGDTWHLKCPSCASAQLARQKELDLQNAQTIKNVRYVTGKK